MHPEKTQCLLIVAAICIAYSLVLGDVTAQEQQANFTVTKIWDKDPHSAFTDLAKWNDKIYCAFRVGSGHVPRKREDDGEIQVIVTADDGKSWQEVTRLKVPGIDLRDPKLSVTPDNRLMILAGGSHYENGKLVDRLGRVAFLDDKHVDDVKIHTIKIDPAIKSPNDWLWRVTWHDGVGYGIVYQPTPDDWGLHLVKTTDGITYKLVSSFDHEAGEGTVRFAADGIMHVVIRNDRKKIGHYGTSRAPYTDWKWNTINRRLGGPNLIQSDTGAWFLGTREYGEQTKTVLGFLESDGSFTKLITLPSGGDTSYPGFVVHKDQLWMSYYSSHEGRAAIYLAKID